MNGVIKLIIVSFTAPVLLAQSSHGALHAQTVPHDPSRAVEMRNHYSRAMKLHAAVIRGDLEAVRASAALLTAYEGPARTPPAGAPRVTAIREAAKKTAAAGDIVSAAYSTALLLTACGDCHRSIGTMPAASLGAQPQVGGVVGHMLAHQRAADQMLQGLIVPSDSLWREGTRAFAAAPLQPLDLPVTAAERHQLAPIEERIHRTATDAVQATEARSRAAFYGQMLAGCADCHKQHAKLWGPKPK